jgi:B12-binding domain/radical SAM domain protein
VRSLDVAFIHAPSVFDFRKQPYVNYGPISDVVPSKPIFDMYPAGFFSLVSYLEERGIKTGIFNIAAKMINDPRVDVDRLIRQIDAKIYGIDLHWLVHSHGAIEIAKIVKELKGRPVILGGLSSTYYWRELLEKYPYIDAAVLGDTTEPVFYQLVTRIETGSLESLKEIPNLAYRTKDGKIRFTGIRYVPTDLDELRPKYDIVVKVMVRSGITLSLPWSTFLKHPVTAVITYKGCTYNCLACGGSHFTYSVILQRKTLGVKKPETLFEEYREITERLKAPIFFVNDLQVLGKHYIERLSQLLSSEKQDVEVFFEFFVPPPKEILRLLRKTSEKVYLQISPESHDEETRKLYGRPYTNQSLKAFLRSAEQLGFERVDMYFMIGLPGQTVENVRLLGKFFEELWREAPKVADAFVAPLAPFVDPGSVAFHKSSRYGYKLYAYTLTEHRELLLSKDWHQMLNYETLWMTRREIAEATYNAVESLAESKHSCGIMDDEYYSAVVQSINLARQRKKPGVFDSKETLREEELYPTRRTMLSYLTPRLAWEIVKYKFTA